MSDAALGVIVFSVIIILLLVAIVGLLKPLFRRLTGRTKSLSTQDIIIYIILGLILIVVFLVFYFKPSDSNIDLETKRIDSMKSANLYSLRDSAKVAEKYASTANVAYDNITFGMSRSEYESLDKASFPEINGYSYSFTPFFTNDDKLYQLNIKSYSESANQIDASLDERMKSLARVIEKKYDTPIFYDEIQFFDFKPGYIQWFAIWDLGPKMIKLGMSEEPEGSRYRVVCSIYNKDLRSKMDSERKSKNTENEIDESSKF